MAILNVTPDSFSDGGLWRDEEIALRRALEMIESGADIIDVGGESTRPGADPVDADEEIRRCAGLIAAIKRERPNIEVSIDTMKYETAKIAVESGATIINDVSGLDADERLAVLAADTGSALVLMHMKGLPRTMQANPVYEDVVGEVFNSLKSKIEKARAAGVNEIIADPGIGFGKTVEHNFQLLARFERFRDLGVETMLGISRKSFIGKTLSIDIPAERDGATAVLHALLLIKGADYLRVHNPKSIFEMKRLYEALVNAR